MAGRVSLIPGAMALLALAGCGGAAATPTPVPATPAPTTAATVTSAPVTPAPSTRTASVAPSASPAGTPTPSSVPTTGLEGIEWQLISISDGSLLNPIPEGTSVTMTLRDGTASGSSGCNTYTTLYSLNLQQIGFSRVVRTDKLCDDDANRVESNYIAALGTVARFGEQQAGMIFFSPSGAPALLYLATPTGTLAGDWGVTAYQDERGAVVAPVAGTPVTVSFVGDGTLSGSDGCNSFNGTYTETGVRMVVSGLSGTRVACPSQELTAQEEPFLAALQASTLWSASQTGLVLRGSNGIVTLTLERAGG